MKGQNIVVTGGAGFIGSNLTRFLHKEQNEVTIIDNLLTGHRENVADLVESGAVEFLEASITDLDVLQKAFQGCDYVFHEAALPSVPRSVKDPVLTNQVNITGTLNVLVAAKAAGVQKVVYASSSSVYGDTPTLPKHESMTPSPLSPYAVSKLAGEYYCRVFTGVFHLPTVALRYFNVYGPRQDPKSEYAAVIPKFITSVLSDKPPVIYGDGTQTRDFSFVDDVVQANVLAAQADATGVFNIAGGSQITVNELARTVMTLCGKNQDIVYEPARSGDIKHSLADISAAKETLGFHPGYDMKKGLKETVAWFQAHQ